MCLWDRFMKNTHEVLGPLNELTSQTLIEDCRFIDEERRVRMTNFGTGATATVNGSEAVVNIESSLGGRVALPPYGFLIDAGSFVAFHALSWGGRDYEQPVLFTMRSLDGRPVADSESVRVFHGLGDARLSWRGRDVQVEREIVLD
jgi:hypothetical protein